MNFFQEFIQEGLNGLKASSIKVYILQILMCAILAIVASITYKFKTKKKLTFPLVLICMSFGIIVPFARYSTPLAILCVGTLLVIAKMIEVKKFEVPIVALTTFSVLGISAGYYVFAAIGFALTIVYYLLRKPVSEE